jgi:hypothetical protein
MNRIMDLISIKNNLRSYNLNNILLTPSKKSGLYIFAYNNIYIYVGMSKQMGIQERLLGHYNGSHNYNLKLWISALGSDLTFSYEIIEKELVEKKEKKLINFLQPITNKIRYKGFKKC